MINVWQEQDAKVRFSELPETSLAGNVPFSLATCKHEPICSKMAGNSPRRENEY